MEIAITDDVSKSNEPSSWTDLDEINLTSFLHIAYQRKTYEKRKGYKNTPSIIRWSNI